MRDRAGKSRGESAEWVTLSKATDQMGATAKPSRWRRGGGSAKPRGPQAPGVRGSEVAWCRDPRRQPVGSLSLKLGEALIDGPEGLEQSIELCQSALADRLVQGAPLFDVFVQFADLAIEVLLALIKLREQAFDGSAGRRLHALFQGEDGMPVECESGKKSLAG